VRDAWASGQIRSEQCRCEEAFGVAPAPSPGVAPSPTPPPLRRERGEYDPNPSPVATGEGLSDRAPVATGEGLSTHPRFSTACRFRRRIGRGEYGACPARDGGVG
jgi:hypothetical protein